MKERYTLLVLTLIFAVLLYGATQVLGSSWSAPTENFPNTGNISAPIDEGDVTQFRAGVIEFNKGIGNTGISLDFSKKSDIAIGNKLSRDYFSINSKTGGPMFSSQLPITMNAEGVIIPTVSSADSSAQVSGNIIFDPIVKKLKFFTNGAWSTIGQDSDLWIANGPNISYDKSVRLNRSSLEVNGDVTLNETNSGKYYYFPVYSADTYYIPELCPFTSGCVGNAYYKRNFKLTAVDGNALPENRLSCDTSNNSLDCLSTIKPATANDPDTMYDVAYMSGSSAPYSGYYTMEYKKYPHIYNYEAYGGYGNQGLENLSGQTPRYYCDINFNPYLGTTGGNDCALLSSNWHTIPAPPPESGWPADVYDYMWGHYNSNNAGPAVQHFVRTYNYAGITGGKPKFSPNQAKTFDYSSNEVNKPKTDIINGYSFCSLGALTQHKKTGVYCGVEYDAVNGVWRVSYGLTSFQEAEVSCSINCF